VRVLGEEPGLGLPNQHAKACPRFQTMHCWCPPATGPNQPHRDDCSHYRRPGPDGPVLHATVGSYHDWAPEPIVPDLSVDFIAQSQAYHAAFSWMEKQSPIPDTALMRSAATSIATSIECNACTCVAFEDADVGHVASCPLGERAESDAAAAAADTLATVTALKPGETW
jgi:hypothetical protein